MCVCVCYVSLCITGESTFSLLAECIIHEGLDRLWILLEIVHGPWYVIRIRMCSDTAATTHSSDEHFFLCVVVICLHFFYLLSSVHVK